MGQPLSGRISSIWTITPTEGNQVRQSSSTSSKVNVVLVLSSLRKPRTIIWSLAFALALAYFWTRGPARALAPDGNLDFEVIYNGIQTFQEGYNPYLAEDVLKVAEAHNRQYSIRHYANVHLLYAPGFLSLFDPIARLEYRTAASVWSILQLAAFAALLAVALALAGLHNEKRKAFLLAGLCFAPIHTSVAHGQPGIFFCLLTLVFFWALTTDREWVAAIAFGLLLGKPSFAVPAALVGVVRGRWRAVLLGCVVGVLTWLPFLSRYGLQDSVSHYATAIPLSRLPAVTRTTHKLTLGDSTLSVFVRGWDPGECPHRWETDSTGSRCSSPL